MVWNSSNTELSNRLVVVMPSRAGGWFCLRCSSRDLGFPFEKLGCPSRKNKKVFLRGRGRICAFGLFFRFRVSVVRGSPDLRTQPLIALDRLFKGAAGAIASLACLYLISEAYRIYVGSHDNV
jgi:hypothetical protein